MATGPGARPLDDYRSAVAEALASLDQLGDEEVSTRDALGRVMHRAVRATLSLPPFPNSQMDGYAVDTAALGELPVELRVQTTVAAGFAPPALKADAVVKVMTGTPMPAGADAVIPVEDVEQLDDGARVRISRPVAPGTFVRDLGSDVEAGAEVLAAGARIGPNQIALLAAIGIPSVPVKRLPRVAIIATGDELIPVGSDLGPGQIYESNGIALAAHVVVNGGEVVSVEHVGDDPQRLSGMIDAATQTADLVLTSGGISMGDFEVVRQALEPRGFWFGRIGMQPGGPQGFGVVNDTPVLNFPGNPVSTVISFELFARPALRHAAGLPPITTETARLTESLESPKAKAQFRRGHRRTDGQVDIIGASTSHLIAALAHADVLVEIPAGIDHLDAGADVTLTPLSDFGPAAGVAL